MATTPVIPVESTTLSLPSRVGNQNQLSGQAAVALSEILIETQSYESLKETAVILAALLQSIIGNTTSGDLLTLSVYAAQDICDELGIPNDVFLEKVRYIMSVTERIRKRNPLSY